MADQKFPKTIFITKHEEPNEDVYYIIHEGLDDFDEDGQEVAVYELKSVSRVEIEKRIIEQ